MGIIKEYLKITDDPKEIREIAERLVKDITIDIGGVHKTFYTPLMLSKMDEEIQHYDPSATPSEREELRYKFIYDYWVYGCTVDEEFYLHLKDKTDAEKREYMVRQIRNIYVRHLNWDAGPDRVEKLEDKYRLYQILKPYYKRDVIEIRTLDDLELFTTFAKKHKVFVVKPADFSFGIGVHKFSMDGFGEDYKAAMKSILSEGEAIHEKHPSKVSRMVLEELIDQDESLAVLHRDSVNGIRATAVRGLRLVLVVHLLLPQLWMASMLKLMIRRVLLSQTVIRKAEMCIRYILIPESRSRVSKSRSGTNWWSLLMKS